jgi:Predicted membrane protein (DUF2238)
MKQLLPRPTPEQWFLLGLNVAAVAAFCYVFATRKNYEFLLYVGVIIAAGLLIVLSHERVRYPRVVLWGLTLWGLMHMAGGGIPVGSGTLYGVLLVPLGKEFFRYDQLVHVIGFGVATLLMYTLLRPWLAPDAYRSVSLGIVIVMAGLGVGALNEIVEFIATLLVPETGVGGYVNTCLDLVSDALGAVLALVVIRFCKGVLP